MSKFQEKSSDQIDTWILNFERLKKTQDVFYFELLEERARRNSKGLKTESSMKHLKEKACSREFTTYGDLAKASEVEWSAVRHNMNGKNGHLDGLLDICHARNLPLLTALCVNQTGLKNGDLEDSALDGFVKGARRLGYSIADGRSFLRECQKKCFEWGKKQT